MIFQLRLIKEEIVETRRSSKPKEAQVEKKMKSSQEHTDGFAELFGMQVSSLNESQFLVLLWAAQGEDKRVKYNITNCFDDLKQVGITRTKQTAVAVVESMRSLCFIDIRDERNRKNIYITSWGAQALASLVSLKRFVARPSSYLEEKEQ